MHARQPPLDALVPLKLHETPAAQGCGEFAHVASLSTVHALVIEDPGQVEQALQPPDAAFVPLMLHVLPAEQGTAQTASLVGVHAVVIDVVEHVEHAAQLLGVEVPVALHVAPATQGPEQTGAATPPAHVQPGGHVVEQDGGDDE